MTSGSQRIAGLLGAVAAVAAYWSLDRALGPFAAVRRYGRSPAGVDWAFQMPAGEWYWYLAAFLASLAAAIFLLGLLKSAARTEKASRRFWLIAFALLAFCLAGGIRQLVLRGAPLTDDEMVYRFQAQTLAAGELTAPPPPDERACEHIFLGVYRGRWFGQYSFGHPLVLALGERVGLIGLVGPLLAALLVPLIFLLARRLFDEPTALLAAGLAAISPLLASTGATLLAQNSATVLVVLGLWLVLRAVDTGRFADAFGAALSLGAAFWCRQQEPALLGAVPILLLLRRVVRGPSRWSLLSGAVLGSLLTVIPYALLNYHLWGSYFWTNYQAYWWGYRHFPVVSPFGFGPAPWEIVHTPLAGLRATWQNLARLDFFLLGLPAATALAGYGFWRWHREPRVQAVFAGVPLTFAVLFFYFWPGLADTGPQLYHTAGAILLPFIAAGLLACLRRPLHPATAVAALLLIAALTFWPAHLGGLYRAARAGDELPRLVRNTGLRQAVVFTDLYPWAGGNERSWVLGRPLPRPDLSDDVLYLRTGGTPVDRQVAARFFPDRRLYVFKLIKGKAALLPLDDYTGEASLEQAARERDLPLP